MLSTEFLILRIKLVNLFIQTPTFHILKNCYYDWTNRLLLFHYDALFGRPTYNISVYQNFPEASLKLRLHTMMSCTKLGELGARNCILYQALGISPRGSKQMSASYLLLSLVYRKFKISQEAGNSLYIANSWWILCRTATLFYDDSRILCSNS